MAWKIIIHNWQKKKFLFSPINVLPFKKKKNERKNIYRAICIRCWYSTCSSREASREERYYWPYRYTPRLNFDLVLRRMQAAELRAMHPPLPLRLYTCIVHVLLLLLLCKWRLHTRMQQQQRSIKSGRDKREAQLEWDADVGKRGFVWENGCGWVDNEDSYRSANKPPEGGWR